ncbi:MAG TPA: tetratricopeptide repeat protein [Rudaea sp.]|nr:tetratricopeptide repeat protein [Rudaea sp.]
MSDTRHLDANLPKLQAIEADIAAGRLREAGAAIEALATAAPSDPRVYLAGSVLARATGNLPGEIESLRRAVALAPHRPRVRLELAKALARAGNHAEALAAANAIVEMAPADLMALEIAVAIAEGAGDLATMQRHLQSAAAIRPNDASIQRALGKCLADRGLHAEAVAHWSAVLAISPDDALAWGWLGGCLMALERTQEARDALQRGLELLPGEPSMEFHLAIARGETPRTQPKEIMQELFDKYAPRFDAELVGALKYRVPRRVADFIRQRSPSLDVSILDLGCGTGLLGVYLGPVSGAFVGVDLSARMLERAASHRVYTELRQAELLDELRATPAGTYDYVTANDVFIYVGDLSEVIPAAFKVIRQGGTLIFSCEIAQESEGALVLRPSKRYAHTVSSIQAFCRDAGFGSCTIEPIDLRFERKVAIPGFIAIAKKG